MRNWCLGTVAGIALATALVVLAVPKPAHAFIHEIIASLCKAPPGDTQPPVSQNLTPRRSSAH